MRNAKKKQDAGGVLPLNALHRGHVEKHSDATKSAARNQAKIPSKATLARRWPALKINRYTGAWCDDASSAKGDNLESLIAFLGRRA